MTLQLARDTAANWTSGDPTLAAGQPGFETDTGRLKIGDGSTAWTSLKYLDVETIIVPLSDETSDLTTGTAKFTMRMPYAMTLLSVKADVNVAPVGADLVVDINEAGVTILSTKLSIDDGEDTSTTAAAQPVISDAALANNAKITFDIDQIGSGTAGAGLKVTMQGYRI